MTAPCPFSIPVTDLHDCCQSRRRDSLNIDAVVADIVSLRAKGTELLLVHGGAQTTNAVAEALGHPPQFVTSETGMSAAAPIGARSKSSRWSTAAS